MADSRLSRGLGARNSDAADRQREIMWFGVYWTFDKIFEMACLLCHTDPKVDAALQVLASGRHLFIEKPVAFVPEDVDRMAAAPRAQRL
jgi:hypothetical protein